MTVFEHVAEGRPIAEPAGYVADSMNCRDGVVEEFVALYERAKAAFARYERPLARPRSTPKYGLRTIGSMALPIDHRRMTVEEFERYAHDHTDQRLELIDGEVHTVSPESVPYVRAILDLQEHLRLRYPNALVIPAGSVRLDNGSLWEPDLFVVDDLGHATYVDAANVLLAVEVALSSWAKDTGPKLLGYARNGVPEYWVIDPRPGGALHRFTHPHLGGYRDVDTTDLPDGLDSLPF